jgi:hypothetical protein
VSTPAISKRRMTNLLTGVADGAVVSSLLC